MKIYLFNDTSASHSGCKAVMKTIKKMFGNEIIARHKVHETKYDYNKFDKCDTVIVNGEGTMHHAVPMSNWLMQILDQAQKLGKNTMLINTVFQQRKPYYPEVLKKLNLLTVREIKSYRRAKECGGRPELCLDLCVGQPFNDGKVTRKLRGVVAGYTHDDSIVHGIFDGLKLPRYGFEDSFIDMIANLKQCDCYLTGNHHGVYAAGLAGIPFIPVPSNSWKIESLIEWSGVPIKVCKNKYDLSYGIEIYHKRRELYDAFHSFLINKWEEQFNV